MGVMFKRNFNKRKNRDAMKERALEVVSNVNNRSIFIQDFIIPLENFYAGIGQVCIRGRKHVCIPDELSFKIFLSNNITRLNEISKFEIHDIKDLKGVYNLYYEDRHRNYYDWYTVVIMEQCDHWHELINSDFRENDKELSSLSGRMSSLTRLL